MGCQQRSATASKNPPDAPPPAVIVAEVPQRTVNVSAEFVARTDAVPTVEIRARVQGILEQVRFREGSEVKRGQILGYVGSTGNADPMTPHLHFAIFRLGPEKRWWKGEALDPYPALVQ